MNKKQEAIKLLEEYLREQELSPEPINICLDALNLSLSWKPKFASEEELRGADAFVSYSHGIGTRKDGRTEDKDTSKIQYNPDIYHPGLTNIDLAEVILKLHKKGIEKPIFAQWEVAVALEEMGICVRSVAKPREGYLSTQGVSKQFLEDGLREFRNIILVVHPIISFRARATTITEASRLGKTFQRVYYADTSMVRYDLDSVQSWTRSEVDLIRYEIGSRTQHVLYKKTLDAKFFAGE